MFFALARLKFRLLFLALASCLAGQAAAAGLTSRIGEVSVFGVQTHYTNATKVVNGKTVYVEGTPMLYFALSVGNGLYYYHFPYSGDKAKAWLEVLSSAVAAGRRVAVHHSDSYLSSGRSQCANYVEEGCIELLGTVRAPLIQWLISMPPAAVP
jgi:hypothetical protein